MSILPKNQQSCPYLFLAPMEGIGDRAFRRTMAFIGEFDEACTEFLRVPANAHISSLVKTYKADELSPIPLAAQIMGSDPGLMGEMAYALMQRGASRVDLNCGCPSNTVTGKGAGSSLLKEPEHLYKVAKAMVDAVTIPVTAKLRSGFNDTALFKENLLAAQASGIKFLTLHPRTKADGYKPSANWELIAQAKQLLHIPVVGNGDILNVQDALAMLKLTQCDALMIGRGSLSNPWIFKEIKDHFAGNLPLKKDFKMIFSFFHKFVEEMGDELPVRTQINKLKQIVRYFFKLSPHLYSLQQPILTNSYHHPSEFLQLLAIYIEQSLMACHLQKNINHL